MPTNKELLEADAFQRRRMVQALVRGSTDGPDLARRTKPLAAGTVLALLLVVAIVVAGFLGADTAALLERL